MPGKPLPQAHAHNDYEHPRPLLDALDQGFCSIEADVFLVKGELWVSHDLTGLNSDRTLERLYLAPLRERVRRNEGRVYRDGPELTLLIDFKSSAGATYAVLQPLLEQYRDLFATGAVRVIISGNRPSEAVAKDDRRLAYIDGRLPDLEHLETATWMPLISDRWSSHFLWNGEGEIPADELARLRQVVQQAHEQGRRVRFWAIPDNECAWQVMLDCGVDLINTDHLSELSAFLRRADAASPPQRQP